MLWDDANCFSLSICLLILVSISGFYRQQLLLWYLPNEDLLFPSFLLHLLIGILLQGRSIISLPFINLFHYDIWTYRYSFYSVFYNYAYFVLCFILLIKLFQLWPLGASSGCVLSFCHAPFFFGAPFSFWQHEMFQAYLELTLHQP